MTPCKGIWNNHETPVGITSKVGDEAFDVAVVTDGIHGCLDRNSAGSRLEGAPETLGLDVSFGVEQAARLIEGAISFEHFQPFSSKRGLKSYEAGHVAAWMRHTVDETEPNWVRDVNEYNWNGLGLP